MTVQPVFKNEVILGLWPIAGVTTIGVTPDDALATIDAAINGGINTFDTAFSYGLDGESDRYLGEILSGRSDADLFHVVGKVGQRYVDGVRVIDGRPETLRRDAEVSLERLKRPRFETLMLHCVDERTPVEESAVALAEMQDAGLALRIGICNATAQQRDRFHGSADSLGAPCRAVQCPLNLLQRDRLDEVIPSAANQKDDVMVYWTLMKGLLAGKIGRNHKFSDGDSRPQYPIFQGIARARAHRVVDGLTEIASELGVSPASLSVSWAISQPGVTAALVGARRPDQIREVVGADELTRDTLERIERLVAATTAAFLE